MYKGIKWDKNKTEDVRGIKAEKVSGENGKDKKTRCIKINSNIKICTSL
jgi:hypothetical protein